MNPIQLLTAFIAAIAFLSTLIINPAFSEENPVNPGEGRQETSTEQPKQEKK